MMTNDGEIEEAERLLSQATFPSLQSLLKTHLSNLKSVTAVPVPPTAATTTSPPLPSPRPSIISDRVPSSSSSSSASSTYVPVTDYAWDQGDGYATTTVSIFVELPGVGAVKDNVSFSCTPTSFDLKVHGLGGKNYRLLNDNLEKDIVPADSKIIVKKDKVVIKLQKKKGEYSFEHWSALTAKKKRDADGNAKKDKDPMGGLMVSHVTKCWTRVTERKG